MISWNPYAQDQEAIKAGYVVTQCEIRLSGDESRYYVRGGLEPELSTQEGVTTYTRDILTGMDPETWHRPVSERVRLAVGVMRGWAESRAPESDETLIWHRYLAGTKVEVSSTNA